MKRRSAHRDRPALGARERILAAQVAAVGRQPQPAAVDDAVERAVAVVAHVEPLRAVILGAVDQHVAGAIFQRAVVGDLGRIGVVDHRRRMGGGVAHEMPPVARRAGIGAAIDDQPLVRGAHLERQRAGMGDAVHAAARRAAGIDDHQRGAGRQALEAARQRHHRRALARAGTRQHQVGEGAVALPGAVEQRQSAVAVAEEAQHRRQPVDGGDQLGRRATLGRRQRRAHVQQVAQHGELKMRRALGHDAVMHDVALHEAGEPRQRLLQALLVALAVAQEGQVGKDQRLQRRDRLVADQAGARHALEMRALAGEREDQAGGEARIGRRRQPVVVADPRDDALGQDFAPPGGGRPAPFAIGPVVDQADGERGGGRIAAIAQVAQPGEAVQGIEPKRRSAGALPRRVGRFGRHRARAAARQELAHEQALADRRIARPGVGRHGEEASGRAVAQGQGIEAGGEQPAAEFPALAGRRLGRAAGHGADGPGYRPSKAHRTVACLRQRASSFLFFLVRWRIHRPVEG